MSAIQQILLAGGGSVTGQEAYTTSGTYSWVCPAGVTAVSAVVVGRGSGNGGGALAYKNNITVVPGSSYTVFVASSAGARCYFISEAVVSAGYGSSRTGDGGGNGGACHLGGGGGAGGYSGDGGNAATSAGSGSSGTGGGGGGGGAAIYGAYLGGSSIIVGAGGGVGLLGQGSSGSGGAGQNTYVGDYEYDTANGGGGGSGGATGGTRQKVLDMVGNTVVSDQTAGGGSYGGAPSEGNFTESLGAVRIIWPGDTRQFPSTNTANM